MIHIDIDSLTALRYFYNGDPLEITLSVQECFTDALFKLAERFT